MKGAPSDSGRTRVPDLRRKNVTGVEEAVVTNEQKSRWLLEEFYPKRGVGATDPPPDTVYPEPLWEYRPLTEKILYEVAAKMKPWKATRSGSFPNSIYKFCADLIVPRMRIILRALDTYRHEPADWKSTEKIVGRKPDYSNPGAHRPLTVSHGHARFCNAAKTAQASVNCKRMQMLPGNHYGG
ncbi:hypothetical protein DFH09DRAFT_925803, partial [Mycena vulgaris]